MGTRIRNLLMLLSVFAWSPSAISVDNNFLLSKGKAGPIKIGMSVDDLYAKVDRARTKLIDLYSEGFFTPALEIYLNQQMTNRPSLVVGLSKNWTVHDIFVYDPGFKTDKGFGVGSTLGDIRKEYRVNWIGFGERGLVAHVEQIGMSFALDFAKPSPQWYKTQDQALIPGNAKVVWVLVIN